MSSSAFRLFWLHAGLLVNVQGVGHVALEESADQLFELRN